MGRSLLTLRDMPSFRKSILSQYLRTKCDRQLKLGMYRPKELEAMGWPVPLMARPAVEILRDRGRKWEQAKLGDLEAALPQNLTARKEGEKYVELELAATLRSGVMPPRLLIQASFGDDRLRAAFLAAIGIPAADAANIPKFGTSIPDILLVLAAGASSEEVLTSGHLKDVSATDTRNGLSICDIKHAGEANSSYSAEVALYAVLLSNWLQLEGLSDRYFVSSKMGLWTRAKETSTITRLITERPGASVPDRIAAFLDDWEFVDFETFFQTVDHFFKQDLPRVLNIDGWTSLDWHVDSRCSNCDFLGYVPWLNVDDRQRLKANRDHYCVPAAQDCGHLSRIATLTRGSRKTLEQNGHGNVTAVAALEANASVFDQHNALRADRAHLRHRATSLTERVTSLSVGTTTIDFPRYADLEIFVTVNFDPGTGLMTALGSEARFRQRVPFGQTTEIRRIWGAEAHVLLNGTLEDERHALISFLSRLAEIFTFVNDGAVDRGGAMAAKTRCQLYFWDPRQFEELTRAVGRHLPIIVAQDNERYLRGLIWLFPPEPILDNEEIVLANPVSLMKPIIQRDVRLPVPHSLTLFNVAEAYHEESYRPSLPGSFYRDPFSDMIPRERIYEIWTQEPLVKVGSTQRTRAQCISDYSEAVKKQVGALRGIVWKFRSDMRGRLQLDARPFPLKQPFNFQQMSEDGRLWFAWAKLEESCQGVEVKRGWCAEADELEASYNILRLTRLLSSDGDSMTYEVSPSCRDCKFRDGEAFLTLRLEAIPGFPNKTVSEVTRRTPGIVEDWQQHRKMAEVFGADLVAFDRDKLRAVVRLGAYADNVAIRGALIAGGFVDLNQNIGLVKRDGISFAKRVSECLVAIGRPSVAVAPAETYTALGHAHGTNSARADPICPAAAVLWNSDAIAVEDTGVPSDHIEVAVAQVRREWPVNDSQANAIRHCLGHRLSIVWGPPGTGKTTTAAAYIVARILAARSSDQTIRILITGPTYTAYEKLFGEVACLLVRLGITDVPCFRIYSSFRSGREAPPAGATFTDLEASDADPTFAQLSALLTNNSETILVGAVVHQCYRIAKVAQNAPLASFFDVAVMDESSQVDVCNALFPLCLLTDNFELALFGDHLQMPPVVMTQAPRGAEWLVGSIQGYLLRRHGLTPATLLINYRSNQSFIKFSRRIGYPIGLTAHSPDLSLHSLGPTGGQPMGWNTICPWFAGISEIVDPERPLTAVTYQDGRAGQANDFEADLVCASVQQLFITESRKLHGELDQAGAEIMVADELYEPDEFWERGIGIVTPHRAQRAVIVRRLQTIFPGHDRMKIDAAVDTVERFQGGQRDTIVISFGVGDPDLIATEEEFLLKLERTNVAISRARAKCILFISEDLAYHLPADRETIATAKAVKCYVNTFCQPRSRHQVPLAIGGKREILIRD